MFVGSLGCKSSSCHGGAGPQREQFMIWSQRDFHAKAYAVLINARSARIAESFGPQPAQANARCTVCHSPFAAVAPARLGRGAHPDEGVSCESCHGAAGSWLRGHTRTDWKYATRVAAGMRDLRSLYGRANTCVACHQNLEPDLRNAGHPELVFELDAQSVNEPKHWRDADRWNGPRSWLTGQAVALRETSWAMQREGNSDAASTARWNALAWLVGKSSRAAEIVKVKPTEEDFAETQTIADALARRASVATWSEQSVRELLTELVSSDREFSDDTLTSEVLAARAQRLVLALDRLTTALNENRSAPLPIESEMKKLRDDVSIVGSFDAPRFAEHLRALRPVLAKL